MPTDPGPQLNTSLVSRYADLRKQAGGMSESVRGMRFITLLADALVRDGIDAEADQRGPHGEVDVAFCYDGTGGCWRRSGTPTRSPTSRYAT